MGTICLQVTLSCRASSLTVAAYGSCKHMSWIGRQCECLSLRRRVRVCLSELLTTKYTYFCPSNSVTYCSRTFWPVRTDVCCVSMRESVHVVHTFYYVN